MKNKKVFFFASLFLILVIAMTYSRNESAAEKNGLYKENGVYHYYKEGQLVKGQWITIKSNRYYFNKQGVAATGSVKISGVYYVFYMNGKLCRPEKTSLICINGKDYGVNPKGKAISGWNKSKSRYYMKNGLLCKGIHVFGDKFYAFSSKGTYNKTKTISLRCAAKRDQSAKKLLAILGKPVKKKVYRFSCYSFDKPGHDEVYYYSHFELSLFKGDNGKIILEDYMAR